MLKLETTQHRLSRPMGRTSSSRVVGYNSATFGFSPPMPRTDGAYHPFFSPEGEWVGFYSDATDQMLKRVSVLGGPVQSLTSTSLAPGGSWGADDVI